MARLVADYGSDPGARDLVRVLRLPGFFHMKRPDQPRLVEIVEATGKVYGVADVLAAFPPIGPKPVKSEPMKYWPVSEDRADDFDRVIGNLRFIPADDRDAWLRVGMALKAAFGDAGRALWDAWASSSEKYDALDQERSWRSFRRSTGVGLATIFFMAKQNGASLSIQGGRRHA
jgi:hypothetical protein